MSESVLRTPARSPWGVATLFITAVVWASASACKGESATAVTVTDTLSMVSGDSQTVVVGGSVTQPFVVKLLSRGGSAVAGDTVTWTSTGGGELTTGTTVTGADGTTSNRYSSSTEARPIAVTATVGTQFVRFIVIEKAGPAKVINAIAGNGAAAAVGHGLTLTAQAVDEFGNGVSNVTVTWAANGGVLRDASLTTDATGKASNFITLGPTPGRVTITATTGVGSVVFTVDGV